MKPVFFLLLTTAVVCAADAPKPKPEFQYQTEGIQVSRATADEPKVKSFGPETIKAAIQYLDDGAICWVREKTCVNCHTTGPYLSERPALSKLLGLPLEEVLQDFVKTVPEKINPQKPTQKDGITYYGGAWTSAWRSMGLAEWDKHITGKLSAHTERSLQELFARQSADGSFVSFGEVEIPHITTDFELTVQAVRAVTAAPGWLANLKDPDLLARVDKMKSWLRDAPPKNDFDRILRLQLAYYMPEVVSQPQRDAALTLLSSKQHADGGWSLRDMSALNEWHYQISEKVATLVNGLPDAAKPESDAYMTALAIVMMRQNEIPTSDERIQRGLTWLKQEQRVSGRWWMQSLYRGNYSYITYIATAQAMKALALCDEIQ